MFKEFFIKKMLKSKGVPEEQIEPLMEVIEKNPALFQKIAEEIQTKLKQGGDQMQVTMEVMQKYQAELKQIFPK
ncbi:MAG: hypothetical protein WCV68_00435 [Candidatus Paceibacterota bacterium]|jgi:hypothetical protein